MEIEKHQEEVYVCLAIQKIGQATIKEILEKLKEQNIDIKKSKVKKICNNIQKKGLVSINYVQEDGISETAYSMSKGIFSRGGPPIAHFKDITDSDSQEVKELIDLLEENKGSNKGRKPDHCKYYTVNVKWKVKDKVLGFMPFTDKEKMEHYRDDDKNIIFLPCHFRAYIGINMRLIDKSNMMKNYIGFDYGKVKLNGKTEIIQFPVLDGNQGRGIVKYEVVPMGSEITTSFKVPKTDFEPKEFENFIREIGLRPLRGFGGRSMSGFGRLEVIDFKVL